MIKNKFFKSGMTLVVSLLFFAVKVNSKTPLQPGIWEGFLQLNDSISLPFDFEVFKNNSVYYIEIINNTERILVDEVTIMNDSVILKMPIFDSELRCKLSNRDSIRGVWINHARKTLNIINFKANFKTNSKSSCFNKPGGSLDGVPPAIEKWEVQFSPGTTDGYKALAILDRDGFNYFSRTLIRGTFLTETGDYRYLSGMFDCTNRTSFYLSCFDGSHAFLFTGKIKGDSIIDGHFYSGAHHHELWVAKRNDQFELRNPDSLTYLKPGYTVVDFNFKNTEGRMVSLKDKKFKNKVVIVQLMGTWCPNCMDETKYLAPFYEKYKAKGLEVVALAFERTDSFEKAASNVSRSRSRFNANYEFLITMKTGKDQASQALPMLNEVMAFPTTIYIDKKGRVRKIYTGFYGPATGEKYTRFVEETERFVDKLLAE